MNRYNQLSYSDFGQLPVMQLPFEQLDQMLGQYQTQKDTTENLADRPFEYLEQSEDDVREAQEIQQYQQGLKQQLADLALEGNTGKYMSALKQGLTELAKLRTPGGAIQALESRKQQYGETVKELKEKFKNAPSKYLNDIIGSIDIGKVRGEQGGFRGISGPNVPEYRFIGKELIDEFSNFAANERGWVDVGNGRYIYEGTNIEVSEEDVRKAATQFLSQPIYQDQLQREARLGQADTNQYLQQIVSEDFAGLSTIEQQRKLQQAGFDIEDDGVMGPQTQQAMQQYAMQELQGGREVEVTDQMKMQSLVDKYIEPVVEKYAYKKSKVGVKPDPYFLYDYKRAAEKEDTFIQGLFAPGISVKREEVKPKDLIKSAEATELKIDSLETELQSMIDSDAPEEDIIQREAEINRLRNINYKKEIMIERAKEQTMSEVNLDSDLYVHESNSAVARGVAKKLYEETADMNRKERRNYLTNYFENNRAEVQDLLRRGANTTYNPSTAARILSRRMDQMDKKIENKVEDNLDNIVDEQTDIAPRVIYFDETKEGKQKMGQLKRVLNGSTAVLYNEDGSIAKEKQDILGTKDSPLVGDNFEFGGLSASGMYSEGNVLYGTDRNTGKNYFVRFPNSNIDQQIGEILLSEGDQEMQYLGQVMQDPYISSRYRNVANLAYKIPEKIEYNGNNVVVEKTESGVKVEFEDGDTQTYPSPLEAMFAIEYKSITKQQDSELTQENNQ